MSCCLQREKGETFMVYTHIHTPREKNTEEERKRDSDLPGKIQNSIEFGGAHFEWPALGCTTDKSSLVVCITLTCSMAPFSQLMEKQRSIPLRSIAVRCVRACVCVRE